MSCEKCSEVCQCPMEPLSPPLPVSNSVTASETEALLQNPESSARSVDAWRNELSARLNSYRTRRKAPPPRYPSLRLPFGPAAAALRTPPLEESLSAPTFESSRGQAFRPEETENKPSKAEEPVLLMQSAAPAPLHSAQSGAKIIEFPRFAWGPPPAPLDQLAEPVIDRPRILEVPEVAPPPPALGGITIEPTRVEEPERVPGIDIPLQSAPLGRRLLASMIDWVIIGTASALFGLVFWKVTAMRPPQIQIFALAASINGLFWASYQYLLMVYAATTPGLRLARLELTRFDGSPTRRSLRRWRVLASYLSAASLGMGYAWLFLDEDSLCWHDRITHTYLAPKPDSKS
jgi:RDD family